MGDTTVTEMLRSTLTSAVTSTTSLPLDASAQKAATMSASYAKDVMVAAKANYVMSAYIGPILCLLGMAGNVLSVVVWNRPGMRSSTGRYLTGQAIADFLVLFFFIVVDSARAWNPTLSHSVSYAVFFCYIGYPIFFLAIVVSIWITVGVTIDRYIMVCWFTKAKELCSEKRANIGLLLITVNSFLINLPHFASFEPNTEESTANKTIGDRLKTTEFEAGPGGKFYEFWIHCIVLILVPWFTVLALNLMIIKKIKKSNRKMTDKKSRESIKKTKSSERQITRLLLAITFSFLFFIGLQCVIQCIWMQRPASAYMPHVDASFAFAKTGIVFNSSLNFVLYCLTGRRFRQELAAMFGMTTKDAVTSSMAYTPSTGSTSATISSSVRESAY